MTEVEIDCENFAGSLTKLLRLLLDSELDIFALRLEHVVEQVVQAIMDAHTPLAVDEAGTHLVLCSTMLRLKSRRLLPVEDLRQTEASLHADDPALLSIVQGLTYESYREVVDMLENLAAESALLSPRGVVAYEALPSAGGSLQKVSLLTLVAAFEQAMRLRQPMVLEVSRPACTLAWGMSYVRQTIEAQGRVEFSCVFPLACSRLEIVMIFLGLLELVRLGEVLLRDDAAACYLESREAGQVA
ncbi:MAG: segregation/condensation protein A [Peptococcaceae bacterium]|nr:segregation/condensation protein A [Peptococcaceae bacterium]